VAVKGIGKVYLIGAGPGDPGLMTLRGKQYLEQADVVLYDHLVNEELLNYAGEKARRIYVGKQSGHPCVNQQEIEELLILLACQGQTVARLKGGDPFVFGRGGEEALALRRHGIPFEIVPGVSSAIAVPAYAGIPVTHRDYASSVAIVTGHRAPGARGKVKWKELAANVDTMVVLMGINNLKKIMTELLAGGCEPERPVALIQSGTRRNQKTLLGTVKTIAFLAEQENIVSPAVIVVGRVARLAEKIEWFESELLRDPQAKCSEGFITDRGCNFFACLHDSWSRV
jgi:uroporphyrin-III C-methyltransferase